MTLVSFMKNIDLLKNEFGKFNIALSDRQVEQFVKFYEMLVEKNKVMNLTAITEWNDVVVKHFTDSISIIKAVPKMTGMSFSLIDVGTGAGFPGIPLKIMLPDMKITLLDSLNKRVDFLNEVTDALGLENIIAVHGRAEDFGRNNEYRERFDLAVSRAVAKMTLLSEICLPFVKVGGSFIAYKTKDSKDELEEAFYAIGELGGNSDDISEFEYALTGSDTGRVLYNINKIKEAPLKYPRKAGVPQKKPLLKPGI